MAVLDGAGSIEGAATATASGSLFATFSGAAAASGAGEGSGTLEGILEGFATGTSLVWGETHPFGAGAALGAGVLNPSTANILAGASGVAAGTSVVGGSAGVLILSSGHASGQGTLAWNYLVDGAGIATGASSMTGAGFKYVTAVGRMLGTSRMVWSYPMPMRGRSVMVGHAEVVCVPPLLRTNCTPPKTLRYLELIQRGDLAIYISDRQGPVSPVRVTYTMYWVRANGTRLQVGPADRIPARGAVGEFYATGRAGEQGQPGNWVIKWSFQYSFQSSVQTKEQCFCVKDAVLAADPRDTTVRVRKMGWN